MSETTNNDDRAKYRPKNLNGGRPALFPDNETDGKTVTLPIDTWAYIRSVNPSISLAIEEIATYHQHHTN